MGGSADDESNVVTIASKNHKTGNSQFQICQRSIRCFSVKENAVFAGIVPACCLFRDI
jgi:hypothetical protein